MISDAHSVPIGAVLNTDICIIGAGAAGITLALQYVDSAHRVILLESGGLKPSRETHELYQGRVIRDDLHAPPDRYRVRCFGGSTRIWGGRCVPFDPIDFERRPWIAKSGWPISYDDVAQYYPAATEICEAGEGEYDAGRAIAGGMRPLVAGFESDHFSLDGIERFSRPTDFGERYREILTRSANVDVLLNANCREIIPASDGSRVDRLDVAVLSGPTFTIVPKLVVIAVGGIETPRLLLASRRHNAAGIGNAYDLVGRYYMCHMAGTVGKLRFATPRENVVHGYDRTGDGVYLRRRLALRPGVQRQQETGNFVARLHHPRIPDPSHRTGPLSAIYLAKHFISYEYGKRLTGSNPGGWLETLQHAKNVARSPFATLGFLLHWLGRHTLAQRKFPSLIVHPETNVFSIEFNSEQAPLFESRVSLGSERDALGMQRVSIDWRYSDHDIRTISRALDLMRRDFAASGLAELDYDEEELGQAITRDGALGGHHIGTARMAANPEQGVVDRDCRVFGMENLFVAGSAVFPTSSQANPTLTIVALTLRLARHLRHVLDQPPMEAAGRPRAEMPSTLAGA